MKIVTIFDSHYNLITAMMAICALIVSGIAIVRSSMDSKKQIVVGKIEEIYELTIALYSSYLTLRSVTFILHDYYNDEKFDQPTRDTIYLNYKSLIVKYQEKNMYGELYDKIFRLNVLANSYLKKPLKTEVLAYSELFEVLIEFVFYQQRIKQQVFYKEGFPTQINMSKFIDSLEAQFIEIINIGSQQITQSELENYRSTTFKKKLGLK